MTLTEWRGGENKRLLFGLNASCFLLKSTSLEEQVLAHHAIIIITSIQ